MIALVTGGASGIGLGCVRRLLERYLAGIPAGRPGTADKVRALVVFLLSPEAGFIVGQTIAVDGGASA